MERPTRRKVRHMGKVLRTGKDNELSMVIAKVSSKGQVVIPHEIRESIGLRPGDRVDFSKHGDHVHLTKLDDALEAFLAGPKVPLQPGDVKGFLKERF